jgi:hypothetical protein
LRGFDPIREIEIGPETMLVGVRSFMGEEPNWCGDSAPFCLVMAWICSFPRVEPDQGVPNSPDVKTVRITAGSRTAMGQDEARELTPRPVLIASIVSTLFDPPGKSGIGKNRTIFIVDSLPKWRWLLRAG